MEYAEFLGTKVYESKTSGFTPDVIGPMLFPFQRDIVRWALLRGRAALFEDCGLGKTPQQLEWARHVAAHTQKPVLIVAPLAVSAQTIHEGEKFGVEVYRADRQSGIGESGVWITNYEKMHHFPDSQMFGGIVLDESSILKGFDGKVRRMITDFAEAIPFRLACTATPAPNDYMELGNHAEFLGVMKTHEMLATFFVHDGGDTSKWRLKGHAEDKFWAWVASWAVCIRKPSDIGYDDDSFRLPALHMHQHTVSVDKITDGFLFAMEAQTLTERGRARKESIDDRVAECAAMVNASREPWVVWCNLNAESEALAEAIPDAIEVTGSDSAEFKERAAIGFAEGTHRVVVSKPLIFGYGMNWQHCPNMAFVGLSDSYEQFYQAVRRCWRFGQEREVHCHVIAAETEGAVVRNIEMKEKQAAEMAEGMLEHMKGICAENVHGTVRQREQYRTATNSGTMFEAYMGDCVEVMRSMEPDSVDYSVYSPPFASLYTYSNSERDMGNAGNYDEFWQHYRYLVTEQYRTLKPGRLLSFHCMNLPLTKERHGVIGVYDFRGEMIRMYQSAGFIFHSEVCIWKDPVTAMQRTKAIGLLYKQLKKDSAMSRQGIPDYVVTMRKPGINPDPVTKTPNDFPVDLWQRYASPVWMDINQSDTLQHESAREEKDERHICPLQLEVIERCIRLWSNPGDLVLSPFMGIGSEGHVALKMGRRFTGIELKPSYYVQAVKNLEHAETFGNAQSKMFGESES